MNKVFYKDSKDMSDVPDNSIALVVTSPPYFNIKDYGGGGIGDIDKYGYYIHSLSNIWTECKRVLIPNGKLVINTPQEPMPKKQIDTHHNRHLFDIDGDIRADIALIKDLFFYDRYIWNRTNAVNKLMFGSYPNPTNFYSQNTCEFVSIYVKAGTPRKIADIPADAVEKSKLSQKEWTTFTKQIWDLPIPSTLKECKGDHPAIMPEGIAMRCIRLFSFVGDTVLDPFAGSGTTLVSAKKLNRKYVGYEINPDYETLIKEKLLYVGHNVLFS